MMRLIVFEFLLILVMVGCIQPTKHHKDSPGKGTVWNCAGLSKAGKDKVWRTVEKEARALIDDGQMDLQYVVLYELAINDSNSFYLIKDSYIPAYEYNYPFKIISYRNKQLCFVGLYESPMSINEMLRQSGYSPNINMESGVGREWVLVVSNAGKVRKLLASHSRNYFNVPDLEPYFSGYVEGCPIQIGIMSHDIKLGNTYISMNVDSLKQHLLWSKYQNCITRKVYGEISLKNRTNSTLCLSSADSLLRHCVVVNPNSNDSLYFTLLDSLPIVLNPAEQRVVKYESLPRQDVFFQNLIQEEEPWDYFYDLFCRSAYNLMKVNGEEKRFRVMYDDTNEQGFWVDVVRSSNFWILKRGMYDRKCALKEGIEIWDEIWEKTSLEERKRIDNDAEKNLQEYSKKYR